MKGNYDNTPWDARRTIQLILVILALVWLQECGRSVIGMTPDVEDISYSSAGRTISFNYEIRRSTNRKGPLIGHKLAVNGIFIVNDGHDQGLSIGRVTRITTIKNNQVHHENWTYDICWAATDPGCFIECKSDAILRMDLFGRTTIGPLPEDICELIEAENASIVIASSRSNFVLERIPAK